MTSRDTDLNALARDIAARATVAVGLAGIALIHLLDSIDTYAETRYPFWMYVALMVSCLVLAGLVLRGAGRGVWLAAGGLARSPVAARRGVRTAPARVPASAGSNG